MEVVSAIHIILEVAILALVMRGTRHIAMIEFKVDLMWTEFNRTLKGK